MRRLSNFACVYLFVVIFVGCKLKEDYECGNKYGSEMSCIDFSDKPLVCLPTVSGNLPNCHMEEQCTDYPDAGVAGEPASTDTDGDAGKSLSGHVCRDRCIGELVSCNSLKKEQCINASHCWWTKVDNSYSLSL